VVIDNQCTNIKLVSPVYFPKGTTSHIQLPQKVSSKSIVKANFINDMDRDTLGGALLYRLQWKENPPTSTHILLIWRYGLDGLYLRAFLIKHESTFSWDKDKLKRLFNVHDGRYYIYFSFSEEKWLSDDNIKLKMTCKKTSYNLKIEVIISEESRLLICEKSQFQPQKSLWIDSNR
jgi:hypothetical protein